VRGELLFKGGDLSLPTITFTLQEVAIKHKKAIKLILAHKLQMTARIADRIDINNTFRL
jgi:hypothetical protein